MNLEDEYVEHSIKLEDTESEESEDEDIDEDDVTNLFPSKKIEQAEDSSDSESDSWFRFWHDIHSWKVNKISKYWIQSIYEVMEIKAQNVHAFPY